MALLASSAVALEVESAATGSAYAQVGGPFLGGPIVPVVPLDPSGGPTPLAGIKVPGGPGGLPTPPGAPGAAPQVTEEYPPLDVIAGTVLVVGALEFCDLDLDPMGQPTPADLWWNRDITVSGGEVHEIWYDPLGETATSSKAAILWEAPTTACTVTVTRTATDYRAPGEYEGTSDPVSPVSFQTIRVHQLALAQLSGGLGMFHNSVETAPAWHCLDDWTVKECDGWGNSTWPLDQVKWTRAGGPQAPMLFAGQHPADVRVLIEDATGEPVETLVPVAIRLHAEWPEEGTEFSAVVTVTQLPHVGEVAAVSGPLDAAVDWYQSVTWDWKHDTNWGSVGYVVEDVDVVVDATIPGVGTSHDTILLDLAEATPKRVESVYSAMDGMSDDIDIARAAAVWARGAGVNGDLSWWNYPNETPPRPVRLPEHADDVWCVRCLGGGDCVTLALLGSRACRLAGLAADEATKAYPRRGWSDNWNDPDTCYASLSDPYWTSLGHDTHALYFNAGGGANQFEGYFRSAERFWTCDPPPGTGPLSAPVGGWDSLPQMVTELAVHPLGWPGMEDEGWLCVWPNPNYDPAVPNSQPYVGCYHGLQKQEVDGQGNVVATHTHLIPEPTPAEP